MLKKGGSNVGSECPNETETRGVVHCSCPLEPQCIARCVKKTAPPGRRGHARIACTAASLRSTRMRGSSASGLWSSPSSYPGSCWRGTRYRHEFSGVASDNAIHAVVYLAVPSSRKLLPTSAGCRSRCGAKPDWPRAGVTLQASMSSEFTQPPLTAAIRCESW